MGKAEAKKLQRTMNPRTIQLLVENNCSLSKLRPINSIFYSNDPSCKKQIAQELMVRGFTSDKIELNESTNDEFEYCINVTIIHCIDSEWIDNLTDACIDIATDCCAEYDGWYTELD